MGKAFSFFVIEDQWVLKEVGIINRKYVMKVIHNTIRSKSEKEQAMLLLKLDLVIISV